MDKIVKFIDLFAGMGGLRLGFERAFNEKGFKTECVMTSEIKKHAINVLKHNFKHNKLVGDIREVNSNDIDDFDFLLAGFPCQPFSFAGSRRGFDDVRGTLFFEVARILKEKQPYGFLLENVEGLVTHDNGKTLNVILDILNNLNYNVSWNLLNSKYFGVPQSRNRIYIVGVKKTKIELNNFEIRKSLLKDVLEFGLETVNNDFTKKLFSHYNPKELYGKAISDKRGGVNNIHSWDIGLKGDVSEDQKEVLEQLFKERRRKKWAEETGVKWMDGMPLTLEQIKTFNNKDNLDYLLDDLVEKGYLKLEHPKDEKMVEDKNGELVKKRIRDETKTKGYNIVTGKLSFEFTKILDNNGIAPTLVATDVNKLGVIDNYGIRRLTLREGLRLCGYPDTYSLSCLDDIRDGFDLLGNTVVINVVEEIAKRMADTYII